MAAKPAMTTVLDKLSQMRVSLAPDEQQVLDQLLGVAVEDEVEGHWLDVNAPRPAPTPMPKPSIKWKPEAGYIAKY